MSAPDPVARPVLDLMDGFRASKALFVAVSLGLFDRLHAGRRTAEDLAAELGCAAHALERLLGALAAKGLLSADEHGRFANLEPATRFLRTDSPETLTGYILYSDRILYRLWGRLDDAIREGSNRWEQEFGSKEGIFDHFFSSDQDKETFLRGMHGLGLLSSPKATAAFDLSGYRMMVDLGGGTGHLVAEACRRYPELRGAVFDLPPVKPVAERYLREAGVEDRVQVLGGDFFTDPLPEGDLYAMSRILHDWSDDKVRKLLRRVQDRLPAGGALLICEQLLTSRKDGPATSLLQSLNMLVCTEGRERSAGEYEELLREAGFAAIRTARLQAPVDVMIATKR
jgi:acetylserotonin O-methyltransferase